MMVSSAVAAGSVRLRGVANADAAAELGAAAHALENSGKDEDDEMGVLETKAREALKPLVQDCLVMADELRY